MAIFFEVKTKNFFCTSQDAQEVRFYFSFDWKSLCVRQRKNVGYGFIGTYGQAVRKNENRRRASASDPFRQSVQKNGLDDSPCTNQGNAVRLRSGNARFFSHYGLCPTHRESSEPKKIKARGMIAEKREYIPVHPNPFPPKGIFQFTFCVYRKHHDKRRSFCALWREAVWKRKWSERKI